MRRVVPKSYFLIGAAVLILFSLPLAMAERWRGTLAAMLAPLWNRTSTLAVTGKLVSGDIRRPLSHEEACRQLATENLQLRNEVERLVGLLASDEESAELAVEASQKGVSVPQDYLERRRAERARLLELRLQALMARVIYRSPTSWNGSLWINVGEADNIAIGRTVVAKNSPVVVGDSLIGMIDLVNQHQSRVRLITDPSFNPSVRAARGDPQRQQLVTQLDALASGLARDDTVFSGGQQRGQILEALLDLREALHAQSPSWLLAKGELQGSTLPVWRRQGSLLRGVGFNYDFDDAEGPARELGSGRPMRAVPDQTAIPILQEGDLLVTTGMDGLLPAGLRVAIVETVYPLNEGDYFYEVAARPTVGDLDSLSLVTVLPAQ